ncbi:MAG: MATE family efflux transporter [Eubacteriales bacterium]|nr:MATE family efflux transporter [Eubacteriales bacterium]
MGQKSYGSGEIRDRFTNAMFFRAWWPAMISSVGWSLSDIADAVVVGHHLGAVGLASISLILPVYMVNAMFAHGLGSGGALEYSVHMSRGKKDEARSNVSCIYMTALILSCATAVLGLLFLHPLLRVLGTVPSDGALFEATKAYLRIQLMATPLFYYANIFNYYLRNDGMHRIAAIGSITGNLCDILLNFVLVLGFGMGTGGAALATALGQIISISIYLSGVMDPKHGIRFGLPARGWIREGAGRLRTGLSVSVQYMYQMIFLLLCNNILRRLGGETGIAVFDVLQNTSYLILYLYDGTVKAMQPIVSTYYGENNRQGMQTLFRTGFLTGIGTGTLAILFAECRPDLICMLFGLAGSSAAPLACTAIRIFAAGAFFGGISILLSNFFLARELGFFALFLETLRGAVILIPAALFCSRFGLRGFWWLYPCTEILSLALVELLVIIRGRTSRIFKLPVTEDRIFRRTILSSSKDIGQASVDLEEFCEHWKASMAQSYTVMLAVEEIGMAILKHGFEKQQNAEDSFEDPGPSRELDRVEASELNQEEKDTDPLTRRAAFNRRNIRDLPINYITGRLFRRLMRMSDRTDSVGYIQITVLAMENGSFELHLRDNAVEFNPFSLEGGSVLESEDLDATGILLIRKRSKKFFYRRFQGFNTLVISV